MKLAICVNHISVNLSDNINSIKNYIFEASSVGAECIIFSETALTGLINNDDPEHDIILACTIESEEIQDVLRFCRVQKIDTAFGFFERSGNSIYDSAVYFDHKSGENHVYRRISPGWHGAGEDSEIYRQGTEVKVFDTKIGKISFLICGDLFDDRLIEAVRDNGSDLVIVPFARCFSEGIDAQTEWDSTEKYFYTDQVRKIGKKTALVNYISGYNDGDYFGGALFVGKDGMIINEKPIYEKGILYVDLD